MKNGVHCRSISGLVGRTDRQTNKQTNKQTASQAKAGRYEGSYAGTSGQLVDLVEIETKGSKAETLICTYIFL